MDLTQTIAHERIHPSYQRAKLSNGKVKEEGKLRATEVISSQQLDLFKTLPKAEDPLDFLEQTARVERAANLQPNRPVPIRDSQAAKTFSHLSKSATFYPYNGEGIFDYGWGCCWRATQTALSVLGTPPPFEELFHRYGRRDALEKPFIQLLISKGKSEEEALALFNHSFSAPYQHPYGWSNPLVSKFIFQSCGLDAHIVTIGGIPASLKVQMPEEVVDEEVDFAKLTALLIEHFSKENPLPVVIDDGLFAMTILGIQKEKEGVTIFFGDPHIKGGVNGTDVPLLYHTETMQASYACEGEPDAGLYWIVFDNLGKQIAHSVKRPELMFSRNSYEKTDFIHKPWMLAFPRKSD